MENNSTTRWKSQELVPLGLKPGQFFIFYFINFLFYLRSTAIRHNARLNVRVLYDPSYLLRLPPPTKVYDLRRRNAMSRRAKIKEGKKIKKEIETPSNSTKLRIDSFQTASSTYLDWITPNETLTSTEIYGIDNWKRFRIRWTFYL